MTGGVMKRLSVTWGALITFGLLGCGGNAQNGSRAQGGSGGEGAGAEAGKVGVSGGGGSGGAGGNVLIVEAGAGGDVVLGEAGEGGTGGDGPVDVKLLVTSAWDVTASVEYTPQYMPKLAPFLWSLALDDTAEFTALFSRTGQASNFPVIRDTGARVHGGPPGSSVQWSVAGQPVQLKTFSLSAFDDDSDGIADRLEGTAEGAVYEPAGDINYYRAATFTLSGKPDRTPPKAQVPTLLGPLAIITIPMSEALESASLALTGTSTVPLTVSQGSIQSTSFTASTVLPFGGTWQLTGSAQDFAGLSLDLGTATLETTQDPGVFAQDGFEAEPVGALGTSVARIDASSGLPIPTGNHALFIPRGGGATFHLKRTDGTNQVSLNVVGLSKDTRRPTFRLDAAVIGGTNRVQALSVSDAVDVPTSDATWPNASEPKTLQFALEDTGPDVVVAVSLPLCGDNLNCPANGSLIIDDLHLE